MTNNQRTQSLDDLRQEIDKIDRELVELIVVGHVVRKP